MKKINYFGKLYTLNWVTGTVIHFSKTPITSVHGTANYVSSTIMFNEQLDMLDGMEKRYSFQLKNFDIACLEGDRVTVFWFGVKHPSYFAVLNHEFEKYFFDRNEIYRTFLVPKASRIGLMLKIAIPFLLIGVVILLTTYVRDVGVLGVFLIVSYLITLFLWSIFGSTTRKQQKATMKRLEKFLIDFKHTGSI